MNLFHLSHDPNQIRVTIHGHGIGGKLERFPATAVNTDINRIIAQAVPLAEIPQQGGALIRCPHPNFERCAPDDFFSLESHIDNDRAVNFDDFPILHPLNDYDRDIGNLGSSCVFGWQQPLFGLFTFRDVMKYEDSTNYIFISIPDGRDSQIQE